MIPILLSDSRYAGAELMHLSVSSVLGEYALAVLPRNSSEITERSMSHWPLGRNPQKFRNLE